MGSIKANQIIGFGLMVAGFAGYMLVMTQWMQPAFVEIEVMTGLAVPTQWVLATAAAAGLAWGAHRIWNNHR